MISLVRRVRIAWRMRTRVDPTTLVVRREIWAFGLRYDKLQRDLDKARSDAQWSEG